MTDTTLIQTDDYSIPNLVHWLNAKYRRHGELEDKAAADALEQQAAQIAEKVHQLQAAKIIIAGLEERARHQAREYALLKSHSSDIAGEREANALLTSEVEALRADAERLRSAAIGCPVCAGLSPRADAPDSLNTDCARCNRRRAKKGMSMETEHPRDDQVRACLRCLWWRPMNSVSGHCKRMPPARPDGEAEGYWPMTGRGDWCGEYRDDAALRQEQPT